MEYKKLFDPKRIQKFKTPKGNKSQKADRIDGSVYVYDENIVLAVNVALATGRPLLVRGPSGGGKSSLARNVARVLGCFYYERVVSSRIQARDLLWEVDLLRRLQDAQTNKLGQDYRPYIYPGVFWWAFDRESALKQRIYTHPEKFIRPERRESGKNQRAVVLLDEIDKANPDVPNNLLVPLGSLSFQVDETGDIIIAKKAPLVFLTTNEERQLPSAFLRRCVELRIKIPTKNILLDIGLAHFPNVDRNILETVADLILHQPQIGEAISVAEYLDTINACIELQIDTKSVDWDSLSRVTLWKHGKPPKVQA